MGPWGEHWDVTIYTKNASEFFVWGGFFAPFFFFIFPNHSYNDTGVITPKYVCLYNIYGINV